MGDLAVFKNVFKNCKDGESGIWGTVFKTFVTAHAIMWVYLPLNMPLNMPLKKNLHQLHHQNQPDVQMETLQSTGPIFCFCPTFSNTFVLLEASKVKTLTSL